MLKFYIYRSWLIKKPTNSPSYQPLTYPTPLNPTLIYNVSLSITDCSYKLNISFENNLGTIAPLSTRPNSHGQHKSHHISSHPRNPTLPTLFLPQSTTEVHYQARLTLCWTMVSVGHSVFSQTGTWPLVTRKTRRIHGAYRSSERSEYRNSSLSANRLAEMSSVTSSVSSVSCRRVSSVTDIEGILFTVN